MSLSKYYQSDKGFQPEQIVKKLSEGEFIRDEPLHGTDPNFKEEPLAVPEPPAPAPPTSQESAPTSDQSQTLPPEPGTSHPIKETEQDDVPPVLPPEQPNIAESSLAGDTQPPIDLSQYVDKESVSALEEQAYNKGVEDGLQKAEEDFGSASRSLLSICQQLDTIRETIISNSSKELQDFAFAIAERILRISLLEQDQTILATIEEALHRAVKSDEFTVYIHPEDYKTVASKAMELTAGVSGLNNIVIKEDITVERGGCRIESDNCTIDATLASQFDTIRSEMAKKLK